MSRPAKKRVKAYRGPKYVAKNPMVTFLGGMSGQHYGHLQATILQNHVAMSNMARGVGDKDDWERLRGAMNYAIVMCELGFGAEYETALEAGRDALLACGMRAVQHDHTFRFTGDELKVMNEAMSIHDLQLAAVRAVDIDRATAEIERRTRHRINSTSVMKELRKRADGQQVAS